MSGHAGGRVAVRAADGRALAPCHPARARALLAAGRARVAARRPFTIRLLGPSGGPRPAAGGSGAR